MLFRSGRGGQKFLLHDRSRGGNAGGQCLRQPAPPVPHPRSLVGTGREASGRAGAGGIGEEPLESPSAGAVRGARGSARRPVLPDGFDCRVRLAHDLPVF